MQSPHGEDRQYALDTTGENRMSERLLLRPAEAAIALGVSRSKIYELLSRGALPSVRLGGSIRVPEVQLREWIERQIEQAEVRPPANV
jgi:excisionase family DNA binding protein